MIFVFEPAFAANGVPNLLPFQGRVTDSRGNPINYQVTINIRVYPPTGNCYIFEDTQTVTPSPYGMFSVMIGGNSTGPANPFIDVFNNDVKTPLVTNCVGTNYEPSLNDWRRLQIVVDGDAMPDMQTIGASAFSFNAQLLEGKRAFDYIQVDGKTTQANVNLLTSGDDATSMHHHDSVYTKIDGTSPFTGDVITAKNIYAPSVSASVGIGTYSPSGDIEIAKMAPSIVLRAEQGQSGTAKIDFMGGTTQRASIRANESVNGLNVYSGDNLALGIDQNGDATFYSKLRALSTIGLGLFDSTQHTTLVNGLAPGDIGKTWYNTSTKSSYVWNGTRAVEQAYLDSNSWLSPSWMPPTGVAAGTYGDPLSTPVITVGADGRLTVASTITIKGTEPGGPAGGDLTGIYPNPMITVGAVTNSKIKNDSITANKLNSLGIAVNRLIATDAITGANLTYFECAPGQIMSWTPAGWACNTVYNLSPVTSVAGKQGDVLLNVMDVTGLGTVAVKDTGVNYDQIPILNTNAQVVLKNGSASSPTYSFANSTGTGMYSSAGNTLDFSTSGATRMTVTPTGWVGIGTATPQAGFEVSMSSAGSAIIVPRDTTANRPVAVNGMIRFNTDLGMLESYTREGWQAMATASGSDASFTNNGNTFGIPAVLGTNDGNTLTFRTNGTNKVMIDTTGRMGVGQMAPVSLLDVNGGVTVGSSFSGVSAAPTDGLIVQGNVGVGTNAPNAKLNVIKPFSATGDVLFEAGPSVGADQSLIYKYGANGNNLSLSVGNVVTINRNGGGMPSIELVGGSSDLGMTAGRFVMSKNGGIPEMYFVGDYGSTSATIGAGDAGPSQLLIGNNFNNDNFGQTQTTVFRNSIVDIRGASNAPSVYVTNDGRVGIGTTTPQAGLDLALTGTGHSAIIVPRDSTAGRPSPVLGMIRFNTDLGMLESYTKEGWQSMATASGSAASFINNGNTFGVPAVLGTNDSNTLSLRTNGTNQVMIDTAGKVGIGQSAPISRLDVNGGVTVGSAYSGVGVAPNDGLIVQGKVGVGTNAPINTFDVTGSAAIGSGYSASQNAPVNGLIVEGSVGVGTASPTSKLSVVKAFSTSGDRMLEVGPSQGAPQSLTYSYGTSADSASLSVGNVITLNRNGSGMPSIELVGGSSDLGLTTGRLLMSKTGGIPEMYFVGDYGTASATLGAGSPTASQLLIGNNLNGDNFAQTQTTVFKNAIVDIRGDSNSPTVYMTNDGKVGVGTTAPQAGFDIATTGTAGSALIVPRDTTANRPFPVGGMIRYNTDTNQLESFVSGSWQTMAQASGAEAAFVNGGNLFGLNASLGTLDNKTLSLRTNAINRVVIDTQGRVGIGQSAPVSLLDVNGGVTIGTAYSGVSTAPTDGAIIQGKLGVGTNAPINMFDVTGSAAIGSGYSASQTAPTNGLIVEGNVGVGTASPTSKLSVVKAFSASGDRMLEVGPSQGAQQSLTYSYGTASDNASLSVGNVVTINRNGAGMPSIELVGGSSDLGLTTGRLLMSKTGGIPDLYFVGNYDSGTPTLGAGSASASQLFIGNNFNNDNFAQTQTTVFKNAIVDIRGTGNSPSVYVTNDGKVGIGTTAPQAGVDLALTGNTHSALIVPRDTTGNRPSAVNGMIRFNTDLGVLESYTREGWQAMATASGSSAAFTNNGNLFGVPAVLGTNDNNSLSFRTNGSNRVIIDTAGNVGVGTTNPVARFSVFNGSTFSILANSSGDLASSTSLRPHFASGDFSVYEGSPGAGTSRLIVASGGQTVLAPNGGNVGIGTTAPNSKLEIAGGTDITAVRVTGTATGANWSGRIVAGGPSNVFLMGQYNNQAWLGAHSAALNAWAPFYINPDGSQDLYLGDSDGITTTNTPIVTVRNSNGNVGIGTTAPQARLDIVGTAGASALIVPRDTTSNRPAAVNGMIRFNTDLGQLESYTKEGWQVMATASGSAAAFTNGGNTFGVNSTLGTNDNYSLTLKTNNTNRMTFDTAGNVGVGTTAPLSNFEIRYNGAGYSNGNKSILTLGSSASDYGQVLYFNDGFANGIRVYPNTNGNNQRFEVNSANTIGASDLFFTLTNTIGSKNAVLDQYQGNNLYVQTRSVAGSGDIIFRTQAPLSGAGNERMVITGAGNVGIGITQPQARFHVRSPAGVSGYIISDTTDTSGTGKINVVSMQTGGVEKGWFGFGSSANNNFGVFNTFADGGIYFGTNNVQRMMIDANGNTGFGTGSPQAGLDIATTGTSGSAIIVPRDTQANRPSGVNGMIRYNTDNSQLESYTNGSWQAIAQASGSAAAFINDGNTFGGNATLGTNDNYTLTLKTNNTNRMVIDTAGNVGIGTTAPAEKFHVYQNGGTARTLLQNPSSTGYAEIQAKSDTGDFRMGISGSATTSTFGYNGIAAYLGAFSNNPLVLATNNSARMIIDSSGNVGIGTATPVSKFDVLANGTVFGDQVANRSTDASHAVNIITTSDNSLRLLRANVGAVDFRVSGSASNPKLGIALEGNERVTVTTAGNVGIGTTAPQARLDIVGTGTGASAIIVPRDTQANRPSGVNGMIRYNTDNSQLESYTNGSWQAIAQASGSAAAFINDGNTFGGNATLGTNDNYTLTLKTNNTNRMVIDTAGNVGIGANSIPTGAALSVSPSGTSWNEGIEINPASNGYASIFFRQTAGSITGSWFYGKEASNTFGLIRNGLSGMTGVSRNDAVFEATTNGNVIYGGNMAIGAAAPQSKLDVAGGVAIGTYAGTTAAPANSLIVSGSVGVGTTTPSYGLHVTNNNNTVAGFVRSSGNSASVALGNIGTVTYYGFDTSGNFALSSSGDLSSPYFKANQNTGNSSIAGKLGIGTASPSEQLTVLQTGTTMLRVGDSATGGSLVMGQDSTLGPIMQSHTDSAGNSLQNAAATRMGFNANGYQISTSPATAVGAARTFTERLRVDQNGNVGIGTAAPSVILDVNGSGSQSAIIVPRDTTTNRPTGINGMIRYNTTSATLESYTNGGWQAIAQASGSAAAFVNGGNTFGMNSTLGTNDNYSLALKTNNANRMIIDTSGNVGIGTTNPGNSLHIYKTGSNASGLNSILKLEAYNASATSGFGSGIDFYGTQPNGSQYLAGSIGGIASNGASSNWGGLVFQTNQNGTVAERMRIDHNGNVGIGTTTPGYALDVVGDVRSSTGNYYTNATSGNVFSGSPRAMITFGVNTVGNALVTNDIDGAKYAQTTGGYDLTWYKHKADDGTWNPSFVIEGDAQNTLPQGYSFYVGSNKAAVISSNGNVGIGTTTPNAIFEVSGTGSQSAIIVPRDNQANRPSGINGMLRYNTNSATLESYTNGSWQAIAQASGSAAAFVNGGNTFGMNATLGTNDNYTLALKTNNTSRMVVDTSGNVGVGTLSPSTRFHVEQNGAGSFVDLMVKNTDTTNIAGNQARLRLTTAGDSMGGMVFGKTYNSGPYGGFGFLWNGENTDLAFATNNTERMRILANGKIGIGSSTSNAQLGFGSNVADNKIYLYDGNLDKYGFGVRNSQLLVYSGAGGTASGGVTFGKFDGTTFTENMRVTNSGNVGIGTTNPGYKLEVVGSNNSWLASYRDSSKGVLFQTYGGQAGFVGYNTAQSTYNDLDIRSTMGTQLYLTTSGNIGIGTTSPGVILDVYGTGTQSGMVVPRDTQANRPSGINGMLRYNTSTASLEAYANNTWTSIAGATGAYLPLAGGTMTGAELLATGTASAPSLGFASSPSTGLYYPGSNALAISTAGSERLRIDSSGNVGIGTTTPASVLDVSGTTGLTFRSTNASAGFTIMDRPSVPGDQLVFQGNNGNYSLFNVGTKNATSAAPKLSGVALWDVDISNAGNATQFQVQNSPTYGGVAFTQKFGTGPDKKVSLQTAWNQSSTPTQLVLDTNSNVGIGTASPQAGLDIATTGTTGSALIVPRDTQANRPTGINGMIRYNTNLASLESYTNGSWQAIATASGANAAFVNGGNTFGMNSTLGTNDNYTLSFKTNNVSRMVIDTSGNVGLGVASSIASLLKIAGNGSVTNKLLDVSSTGIAGGQAGIFYGGYFDAVPNNNATDSYGIYAKTSSMNGNSYGVYGETSVGSSWLTGYGLYGKSSYNSGAVNGSGIGVYAEATTFNTSYNSTTYGAYILNSSVYGANSYGTYINAKAGPTNVVPFAVAYNDVERFRVTSNGFLGVGVAAPQAALDVSVTGTAGSAILVPRDTTANRPAGINGMIRYNTSTASLEAYANSTWTSIAGASGAYLPLSGGTMTGVELIPSGSAGAPSIAFSNSTNTGVFSPSAGNISLSANGTAALNVLGSSGYVGIGTAAPVNSLNVASGRVVVGATDIGNSQAGYVVSGPGGGSNFYGYQAGEDSTHNVTFGWNTAASVANSHAFIEAYGGNNNLGLQRFGGNMGVGVPAASIPSLGSRLVVQGSSTGAAASALNVTNSSATSMLFVRNDGNIGIGTYTPNAILDIYGTGSQSAMIVPRDSQNNRPSGINGMIRYNTSTASLEAYANNTWTSIAGAAGAYLPLAGGTMTGNEYLATGTASAPSLAFASSNNTGLYYQALTHWPSQQLGQNASASTLQEMWELGPPRREPHWKLAEAVRLGFLAGRLQGRAIFKWAPRPTTRMIQTLFI